MGEFYFVGVFEVFDHAHVFVHAEFLDELVSFFAFLEIIEHTVGVSFGVELGGEHFWGESDCHERSWVLGIFARAFEGADLKALFGEGIFIGVDYLPISEVGYPEWVG